MTGAAILTGFILLVFVVLAVWSHGKSPDLGLIDGRLRPCPDKPNCVCSESWPGKQKIHEILPIIVEGKDTEVLWSNVKHAVLASGGRIMSETDSYLHAEFVSAIFRFVDDVEMRLDRENGVIHFRSASRVGHSDLGANRNRIEKVRMKLEERR